jgi:hypothetical protein
MLFHLVEKSLARFAALRFFFNLFNLRVELLVVLFGPITQGLGQLQLLLRLVEQLLHVFIVFLGLLTGLFDRIQCSVDIAATLKVAQAHATHSDAATMSAALICLSLFHFPFERTDEPAAVSWVRVPLPLPAVVAPLLKGTAIDDPQAVHPRDRDRAAVPEIR